MKQRAAYYYQCGAYLDAAKYCALAREYGIYSDVDRLGAKIAVHLIQDDIEWYDGTSDITPFKFVEEYKQLSSLFQETREQEEVPRDVYQMLLNVMEMGKGLGLQDEQVTEMRDAILGRSNPPKQLVLTLMSQPLEITTAYDALNKYATSAKVALTME